MRWRAAPPRAIISLCATHERARRRDDERGKTARGQAEGWIDVMIEIPRGSRNKYEYDHERGVMRLDRVLYSSVHYPTDYGFVPGTLSATATRWTCWWWWMSRRFPAAMCARGQLAR